MHHDWRAGMARTDFPIPDGTPMGGYIARDLPSAGTLDALQVGVLLLDDGHQQLAVIGADVIAVDDDLVRQIAGRAGLPEACVLLAASHTHAGPRGIVERLHPSGPRQADTTLRERLVATCVGLLTEAERSLEPVSLAIGAGETAGAWTNRNDPDGPVDVRVRTLSTRDAAGQLIGVVVLSACHPTVLPAENLLISADLSGGIRRGLAAEVGDAPVLLTMTGAAGDTSTRHTRIGSGPGELDRIGAIAAQAALRALASERTLHGDIRTNRVEIALPPLRVDGPTLEAEIAEAEAELQHLLAADAPHATIRTATTRAQGALLRSRLATQAATVVPIPAWRLGEDLALVGIPGELFASLGAVIEEASPFRETWIAGYANGYAGYVPDHAAFDAGTYEALASPYDETVGKIVVDGALRALRDLL